MWAVNDFPAFYVTLPTLAAAWIAYTKLLRKSKPGLPLCTPPGYSWPWGHDRVALSEQHGSWYLRCFEEFGPAIATRSPVDNQEMLTIADPMALHHILIKKGYQFPTSEHMVPMMERIAGKSLFWAQGETHAAMRRLLNPYFSGERVKMFADDVTDCYVKFEEALVATVSASGGKLEVNAPRLLRPLVLDIIGRTSFDHDFGGLENSQVAKGLWNQGDELIVQNLAPAATMIPSFLRMFPWIARLPLPAIKVQEATRNLMHLLGREMFQREKSLQGHSLLAMMVRQNDDHGTDEMLDHLTSLLMAGQETSPMATGTVLWHLAMNQDAQSRLREEVLSFEGTPTYDDFAGQRLPYLDAVVKETFRLHPGVGLMERVALQDDVIPLKFPVRSWDGQTINSIPIKAGQIIDIVVAAADRLKCVWGPEADQWKPERWLEGGSLPDPNEMNHGWARLLAFSQGVHACIGVRMAVYQVKFFVFHLLRKFQVKNLGADIVFKHNRVVVPPQMLVRGRESEGALCPIELVLLS